MLLEQNTASNVGLDDSEDRMRMPGQRMTLLMGCCSKVRSNIDITRCARPHCKACASLQSFATKFPIKRSETASLALLLAMSQMMGRMCPRLRSLQLRWDRHSRHFSADSENCAS